jgi:hypothetical protein
MSCALSFAAACAVLAECAARTAFSPANCTESAILPQKLQSTLSPAPALLGGKTGNISMRKARDMEDSYLTCLAADQSFVWVGGKVHDLLQEPMDTSLLKFPSSNLADSDATN